MMDDPGPHLVAASRLGAGLGACVGRGRSGREQPRQGQEERRWGGRQAAGAPVPEGVHGDAEGRAGACAGEREGIAAVGEDT
jgi:hypothetical protein